MDTIIAQDMTKQKEILLTPPINTSTKQRKNSVTFDLPEQQDKQQQQELLSPCVTSPTIDISAQLVPDTMLVALYDRSSEMRALVHHNKNFFATLASHLDVKWSRFENTLYCDRTVMSDLEWMKRISKALQNVPSLLEKFKELVGYLGDDDEDDGSTTSDNFFSNVDLTRIRSSPERLSKEAYPQFFINCERTIANQHTYDSFLHVLFDKDLSDKSWASKIHQHLDRHPVLLEQFQEIVAYEIEDIDQ